ncbi:MAG: hypothetical protein KKH28_02185 [Elusimicrobia bacterium]|nr:hypothetical protein [Elusimicrobiota bacterium]
MTRSLYADGSASLQFTVAAPDPVTAGDDVSFQTLVVNTGTGVWLKGTYYWVGEVYTLEEGGERKFMAATNPVTPAEDVQPGAAHGAQLKFTIPENLTGARLLYRVFLIRDGKRILETDYRGFQIIEKEFRPPAPESFKVGGDVTFSYKNSSNDSWNNNQGITAANIVGKIKNSSFLFNTYLIHTKSRIITPNIILLNFYAPWGCLSAGDISPAFSPLSLDGQGMRGLSFERQKGKVSWLAVAGRIVAPQEPDSSSAGRFARYTGAFKLSYQALPSLKVTGDAVLSKDDEFSINIDTDTSTLVPQQTLVYGTNMEWKLRNNITMTADYQLSAHKEDLRSAASAAAGAAWKSELKYRGTRLSVRTSVSRVDVEFASFASASTISDRFLYDGEVGISPAGWTSFTVGYNQYTDNLADDPAKTKSSQTQMNFSNALKLPGATMLNTSYMLSAVVGKPATVQDNQTATLNFSVVRPMGPHTLNLGYQTSAFTDNTSISHDLGTNVISLSGAFRLTPKMSLSTGLVNSASKDKVDSTTNKNNSITANLTYSIPRKAMAFQLWTTRSSNKSDSLTYPSNASSLSVNLETVWLKSQKSKDTFGVGTSSRKDSLNPAGDTSEINILTRYNYSF